MTPPPPTPTLFPYTTLFRSLHLQRVAVIIRKNKCITYIVVNIIVGYFVIGSVNIDVVARGIGSPHDTHCSKLVGSRGYILRSEEHTSELQSRPHLVCRLLLE